MADKKFEEMLEHVINGEQAKAESLFHELIVDMSREIYENMFDEEMKDVDIDEASDEEEDEEEMDENVGGDASDDMMKDVGADASSDDSMGGDDSDDMSDEQGSTDDRLTDIEDEVASLKAEFERIMGGEAGEEEHGDMDMDMDMGDEEGDEETNEFAPAFEEEIEEIDLSPAAMMREYVDKVGEAYKGGKVASSSEASGANTKSVVAKKNDMGGTTANIAKGGEGSEKGTAGGLLNPTTKLQDGGNVNVPGAKNATKLNKEARNWDKANDKEDAGTSKKSLLGK